MNWFDVDKAGLAKILERKGKSFVLFELLQNSWDEDGVTAVDVQLAPIDGRPVCTLEIADDAPAGFQNLSHAWTLFAESGKKGNAKKRGRFNLGEKLVLAMCESALVWSTTGGVKFDESGRIAIRQKREHGTIFAATIRMTRDELAEVLASAKRLIPPSHIRTTINGELLIDRRRVTQIEKSLPTEIADANGCLRKSKRLTTITVYQVALGETATLYEMGIPIVETGDKFHVDIGQKVPLTLDRDNVPESYLRAVRVAVLNATSGLLTKDDSTAEWVQEASGDARAEDAAVEIIQELRFGPKRVVYDPSDVEANRLAVAQGYTVIPGGSLSRGQWENVRRSKATLPAGQVTPSPKPFVDNGGQLKTIPEEEWPDHIRLIVELARKLQCPLLGRALTITVANDRDWKFAGACGRDGSLYINATSFGPATPLPDVLDFLLHEFAHCDCGEPGHLCDEYHRSVSKLAGRLGELLVYEKELRQFCRQWVVQTPSLV